MKKIIFITISIIFSVLLYFSTIWLAEEYTVMHKLNNKYITEIQKLKNISKVESWLNKKVKKNLKVLPKDCDSANMQLITFFDKYAKKYSFKVEKFIFKDNLAHFLMIKYIIPRDRYNTLNQFIQQKYNDGYLVIKNFKTDKSTLSGDLILIQPYPSHKIKISETIDAVPQ